jgi:hypothetical protein
MIGFGRLAPGQDVVGHFGAPIIMQSDNGTMSKLFSMFRKRQRNEMFV